MDDDLVCAPKRRATRAASGTSGDDGARLADVVAERDAARADARRLRNELREARAEIARLTALVPPPPPADADAPAPAPAPDDTYADGRLNLSANATAADVCALCNRHEGTPSPDADEGTLEGDLVFPPFAGPKGQAVWVHERCALYSAEVFGSAEDGLHNVLAAVKRGRSLRCVSCKERGATVGCAVATCRKTFHLRCAVAAGELYDPSEAVNFLCNKHRKSEEAVQCDRCFKWRAWRKMDAHSGRPAPLPEGAWVCEDNEDAAFNSCVNLASTFIRELRYSSTVDGSNAAWHSITLRMHASDVFAVSVFGALFATIASATHFSCCVETSCFSLASASSYRPESLLHSKAV